MRSASGDRPAIMPTQRAGWASASSTHIAIAARYAQRKYGIGRALIADWDVHHGNGTQDIFYTDGTVFVFNTHQSPWYPGTGARGETGEGAGEGMTLNCPFPAGSGRKEILGAFQEQLLPAAAKVKPELVLISAGFDSRAGDPLGRFTLTDADFKDLTGVVRQIADQYCGRPFALGAGRRLQLNRTGCRSARACRGSTVNKEGLI